MQSYPVARSPDGAGLAGDQRAVGVEDILIGGTLDAALRLLREGIPAAATGSDGRDQGVPRRASDQEVISAGYGPDPFLEGHLSEHQTVEIQIDICLNNLGNGLEYFYARMVPLFYSF